MFERALITTLALALVPIGARDAAAQDWREVTSFRQRADESQVEVHIRYGAGELAVRPGSGGELYRLGMRYDSDIFDPVTEYRNGRLEVGVEGRGRGLKLRNTEGGDLALSLSPDVPLDLDLDFGAGEARLELGGLRVRSLDIETGASDTELGFSEPNPIACERFEISMGAASFEAQGLGNANCARVKVEGGVGDISLGFDGAWPRDIHADITVALGSVKIRVPEDVGVRVEKDTFLADFGGSRFHERDGVHYSDNWASAERRLTVEIEGAFGSFDVRWIAPRTTTP